MSVESNGAIGRDRALCARRRGAPAAAQRRRGADGRCGATRRTTSRASSPSRRACDCITSISAARARPIVLLAGLGNTAHAFDDFAPAFIDRFHVIALTRRGFGESSHPTSGYDTPRLVEDILAAMDALHLGRVDPHRPLDRRRGDDVAGRRASRSRREARLPRRGV